jgi:hypothetical protein
MEFLHPVPLEAGFNFIERYLRDQGVPLLGFCACELRSPAPTKSYQDGFTAGWLAAFRAISETTSRMIHPTSVPLAMAGAAPVRRRGRPPKSASAAEPIKRRKGRPRKTEATK